MKVLFSADWHIKIGQNNVPRNFQINRYRMLFDKINELTKEGIDLHIIGGDIFDKVPSIEELTLFFEFITNVNIETIIYSGNHEATRKGYTFFKLLKNPVYKLNNRVNILDGPQTLHNIDFIPYTHLKTFNPDDFYSDILATHVRGLIEPHVRPEIDLNKLKRWKVVLAGDLHANSNSQRNIIYPGSPLTISFHRNSVHTGVLLFDTESFKNTFLPLGLPQLLRKTVLTEKEMISTSPDHTIYELVGNAIEVSNINSELLDKKIIVKDTEATLDLNNKSIEEELYVYFRDITKFNKEQIEKLMTTHNDYGGTI